MTTPSGCRRVQPLLEPFSDGELPTERILEVEQHIAECGLCAERIRLERSMRLSVRRCVQSSSGPSAEFMARVQGALCAEREREARETSTAESRPRMLPWKTIVPIAAAAGFTLAWAASSNQAPTDTAERNDVQASVVDGAERLLEQFVDYHAQGTPVQVTDVTALNLLEKEVGMPVPFANLKGFGASWQGGGVIPVNEDRKAPSRRQVASLRYELDGHRITVYVYDASQYPLRAKLEARVVRNEPVYVGTRRGYSIAAIEGRGVGCALATDLGDDESAEIAASIPCTRAKALNRSPARPRGMVPMSHSQYTSELSDL